GRVVELADHPVALRRPHERQPPDLGRCLARRVPDQPREPCGESFDVPPVVETSVELQVELQVRAVADPELDAEELRAAELALDGDCEAACCGRCRYLFVSEADRKIGVLLLAIRSGLVEVEPLLDFLPLRRELTQHLLEAEARAELAAQGNDPGVEPEG